MTCVLAEIAVRLIHVFSALMLGENMMQIMRIISAKNIADRYVYVILGNCIVLQFAYIIGGAAMISKALQSVGCTPLSW